MDMHIALPRRLLAAAIAILILAGGAVLGVLQAMWVGEASNAEEMRLRGALSLAAARVSQDAQDELRVLASLLRIEPGDLSRRDWATLATQLAFWYDSAREPLLLRGVHVLSSLQPITSFSYEQQSKSFVRENTAPSLPSGALAVLYPETASAPTPYQQLSGKEALLVVPVMPEGALAPIGAIVAELDPSVFYAGLLPILASQELKGFKYRVVVDGSSVSETAGFRPDTAAPPEMVVDFGGVMERALVSALAPNWGGHGGGPRPPPPGEDPSLAFWMLRDRGTNAAPQDPTERGRATLEVYYPDGTLSGAVRDRRVVDLALSTGILAALLASGVVLYSLYRRSVGLRVAEQEFVATMSHELRTPISVVKAASENLARGVVSDPARLPKYAEVIQGQINRLAGMVERILTYSGLQSGKRTVGQSSVDISALIREVSEPLRHVASERGASLKVSEEALPATICSDPAALTLILENLVMNAILHASPGEIRVDIARRAFDILRISVEDDGPGVPAREQRRIFEPFVRTSRSVESQSQGSGLGLHLVKRLVGLLGGKITLESPYLTLAEVEQQGCRFTVTLPCRETC